MGSFRYVAYEQATRTKRTGLIEAESVGEANVQLRQSNLVPTKITAAGVRWKFSIHRNKVSLKEKIIFTRQLSVMIKAGLPLLNALQALKKQSESEFFRRVLEDISTQVKGGKTLSQAMVKYPKVFAEVYLAVIKAGESTGQLSEVLLTLADQQEKEADLISRIRGAMIYPAVIMVALLGVVVLIVLFVIPSLKTIFADVGGSLPITTRILVGTSDITRKYWYIVFPGMIATVYALHLWFGTKSGGRVYDKLKIRLPIFGSLTKKLYIARFSRTLAMLTKASLPILEAIKIIRKTVDNVHYDEAFVRIERAVESGHPLSVAIEREPLFPPMVSQLTSLGEESGNLESVLLEVAKFYDKEVDTMSTNLTALLEPVLMIVMGLGVGFVVASVLGPIYGLVQNF